MAVDDVLPLCTYQCNAPPPPPRVVWGFGWGFTANHAPWVGLIRAFDHVLFACAIVVERVRSRCSLPTPGVVPMAAPVEAVMARTSTKQALVTLRQHSRVVSWPIGDDVTDAPGSDSDRAVQCVHRVFHDVLSLDDIFFLQIKDPDWGEYVDMTSGQQFPERSVLRAVLKEKVKHIQLATPATTHVARMMCFFSEMCRLCSGSDHCL